MKKNKSRINIKEILINIAIIIAYLFIGILSFPKENASFNQEYYFIIGIFFILIVILLYCKDLKTEIKEFLAELWKNILKVVLMSILCVIVVTLGNFLKDLIFGWIQMSSYDLVYPNIAKYPLYVFFVMVIYTPLVEGIIFNKSFHNLIKNNVLFVIITSLIYGIMQVGVSLNNLVSIVSIIPYALFFMILSITYIKKKNVFFPIFIWLLYSGFQFFVQSTAVLGWD